MKQPEEDVEASAQLMSKVDGQTGGREHFDTDDDDANDAYSHRFTRRYQTTSRNLWHRLQSLPLPSWLPIRKLSQLNPRYLVFLFAVSLAVTVLIVNPYGGRSTSVDESHTPTPSAETGADTPSAETPGTETDASTPSEPTEFAKDGELCTTWPIDADGNYDLDSHDRSSQLKSHRIAPEGGWQKPEGVKIIAMLFFGRRRYVDILDCYLQQNLAANGGYLDEVWFMLHTPDETDIAWVKKLANGTKDYKIVDDEPCRKNDHKYGCLWDYAIDDHTIYLKLDDDIIYIHPDAIPQLIHTRLAVPHAYGVSANLVNSPITGVEQFHHNVIYPFVPGLKENDTHHASETWRLSELAHYPAKKFEKLKEEDDKALIFPKVPYRGHPFVLLSEDNFDLLHTSMGRYDQNPGPEFIAWSSVWRSWAMAAQQQYSLLFNIEKNRISRYFFGRPATYPENAPGPDRNKTIAAPKREGKPTLGGEQIFDTQFRRYNLNFCAVWGSDIKAHLPMADDDEDAITKTIPKRTGRPFIIDTRAVVGHFSFFTQAEEIGQTDLLDRYRAFANEAVCEPNNLKTPWDKRCPGFKN
ncbi:hypothetical protein F4777DRAFT_182606 [Nemania sp. FL0916]|nr:hypothetical protein F4777DRAFT_182606 [Nemania sp. FL0916]